MKVSLFGTCLVDMMKADIGIATVELLEHLGCKVDYPEGQICCGQPTYNSGYLKETMPAMKRMIEVFEDSEYVVSPSGSCIYMFQEYQNVFKDDPVYGPKAKALAEKSYELTQFIVEVMGIDDVGATFNGKVTYHPSCHMTRHLGVETSPLTLLNNVKELEFTELPHKEYCCGFGGTFSVKMGRISKKIVDEKVEHVKETGAQYLTGADYACLMNISGRMERIGTPVKAVHIVQILNSR